MEVKIVDNFEKFKALKKEWNEALEESSFNTFYLTFEWLATWWEYFGQGHKLFVILIRDSGKLIAAAPIMIKNSRFGNFTKNRKLQFIATGVSDYMDFLIVKKADECFTMIFDEINRYSHTWDWAEFINIPENSPNHMQWFNCQGYQWINVKEKRGVSVILDLKQYSTWEEYFQKKLSKKLKNNLRWQEKRLRNFGKVSLETLVSYDQIKSAIPKFFEFHQHRSIEKGFKSQFNEDNAKARYVALAKDLSGSGRIELSCLKVGQKIAAMHLGFTYDNRYYYYAPAFNPALSAFSPGKLLLVNLIKNSYGRGIDEFDLLLGAESYKFSWADKVINLHTILFFKKSASSQLRRLYRQQRQKLAKVAFLGRLKRKFTSV
ncbi:MAG: GNAT family N-acetyltransferase [Candidatus Omnitrophota bacterium]|nr:GNAT family N-acetyltransferase [Candidatus Omnitrophota bacterium]